jgi:hypothetical protein
VQSAPIKIVSLARLLVSMETPVMKQNAPPNCGVTIRLLVSLALPTRTTLPNEAGKSELPGYVVLGPL